MKKFSLSLIAAMAVAASVSAQEMHFGVSAGVSFFTVNGAGSASGSGGGASSGFKVAYIPGIHLGGYLDKAFTEKFSLRTELLFSQKGDQESYSYSINMPPVSSSADVKVRTHLNYLEIPVQAKLDFTPNVHLLAGPYAGVLLGLKSKQETSTTTNGVTTSSNDTSTDRSNMNALDIGLAAGLGYQMDNGIHFHLKYQIGLSDIDKADSSGANDPHKNMGFQLGAGYSF